jgi:hypothetical protein
VGLPKEGLFMRIVVFVILCSAFPAWAQEKTDTISRDTYSQRMHLLYDPAFPLGRTRLLVPPHLDFEEIHMGDDILLPRNMWGPSFGGGVGQRPIDLTASFRFQLDRQNQMRPLMNVLGTFQAGAAAYIAYRHVKKYGFLK